jgi:hypothetical protein
MTLDGDPYMHSSRRASRGAAVHADRLIRSDGTVWIRIDDWDRSTGDGVRIELSRGPDGMTKAEAVADWDQDPGPPLYGVFDILNGRVVLSSEDWSKPSPLIIEFDIQCQGTHEPFHETGRVSVP